MENEQLHGSILKALGILEGKVDTGFININQRLDALNGKVAKHEGRLHGIDIAEAQRSVSMDAVIKSQGVTSSMKSKWLDRLLMFGLGILLQLLLIGLIRTGIVDINPTPIENPDDIQARVIELQAETEKLKAKLEQQQ